MMILFVLSGSWIHLSSKFLPFCEVQACRHKTIMARGLETYRAANGLYALQTSVLKRS